MPYKRKDSPIWWVSFIGPSGQRVRRSTETTNRKEADALEAKWKLEAYRVKQWDEEPTRTFEELAVPYLKESVHRHLRSAEKYRQYMKQLRKSFAGTVMNTLRPADVRAHVARRREEGMSNATINRELEVLSCAINYANREWEWELPNPVRGRKLKEPEGRMRWITRAEAVALIAAAESEPRAPHLADFIRLALNTGCRSGELLGLEWRRVDLNEALVHLEGRHTKSGKRRSIPLNRAASVALVNRAGFRAHYCPASPWVFCNEQGERIANVQTSFTTARKRAGIEDFRIHDMRHTCAAWLVSSGVPLPEVRDLLGHSMVKTTERYAHLAPDNVRAAVAVLDGDGKSRFGYAGNDKDQPSLAKSLI